MYSVAMIHVDRADWAAQLESAIGDAARRHAGDSVTVQFTVSGQDADIVLCLGSRSFARGTAGPQIATALARGIRILPIVSTLIDFKAELPPELHAINGKAFDNIPAIAEEVLRHLGLTERDRRVFLSYLRREATSLAYQLHDELQRRRFAVFLDSFDIEHGEWVQNRIEQALQYTSFVLLIYSKSVETSEWVEKEINFALAHGLGLVILALPGAEKRPPFKLTPSDRGIELKESDVETSEVQDDCRLKPEVLRDLCTAIEREHADQFRSRRERLIEDVQEALGSTAVRVGTQSLRYQGAKSEVFIRLSPRPPETRDLYLLDQDCPVLDQEPKPEKRMLVAIKGGYEETRDLTEWVCISLKHQVDWCEPQAVCADPGVLES